jgi:peptidoglycan/LPS O-acetylase OafA/YrhL
MPRFRRITTQANYISQIDGLRFVAISSVVIFHIYSAFEGRSPVPVPWHMNTDTAKRGVELFFVISGFILGVPFASTYLLSAPKVDLKSYFVRRLTRLEPPYLLSLIVWAAWQMITVRRSFSDMAPHFLTSMSYLHNIFWGGFPGVVNPVAWSLEVEVQFYVLAPVLTSVFAIRNTRLRRMLMLGLMAVTGVLSQPLYRSVHFHYSIGYYLGFFLAGLLVCDLYLTRQEWKPLFWYDLIAVCGWPMVWVLRERVGHILLPFLLAGLCLTAFRGLMCSAALSTRAITNIGGMCYSIYLFHFIVIYVVKHVTSPLHVGHNFYLYFAVQSCIIISFVLLFCGTFFILIERPCMDREWPQKAWQALRCSLRRLTQAVPNRRMLRNAELS